MAVYGKHWNGYLQVNSVDLSARVKTATFNAGKEVLDMGTMGSLGKIRALGLEDHSINVTFEEDLSSAATAGDVPVNATLRGVWNGAVPVSITFALNGSAASATNPTFTCDYILDRLPMGGQHGQPLETTVTFLSSDAAAMVIGVGA